MNVFLQLLLALLFGTLCADQARKRGRHSTIWFFLGALFNLFALVTLFILPSLFQGIEMQGEGAMGGMAGVVVLVILRTPETPVILQRPGGAGVSSGSSVSSVSSGVRRRFQNFRM